MALQKSITTSHGFTADYHEIHEYNQTPGYNTGHFDVWTYKDNAAKAAGLYPCEKTRIIMGGSTRTDSDGCITMVAYASYDNKTLTQLYTLLKAGGKIKSENGVIINLIGTSDYPE